MCGMKDSLRSKEERQVHGVLPQLGYVHETVNQSQHFVNPASAVHTNKARWSIQSDAPTSAVRHTWMYVVGPATAQRNGSIRLPCDSGAVSCVALTHPLPQQTNQLLSEPPTFCRRRQHDSCVLTPSPIRNPEVDNKQTEYGLTFSGCQLCDIRIIRCVNRNDVRLGTQVSQFF